MSALLERIHTLIIKSGETRCQIWKATGIDQATLSRFMAHKRGLSLGSIELLAEHFGWTIEVKSTEQ